MGLSICESIISSHGGKIWAENTGSGARIRFSLNDPMLSDAAMPLREADEVQISV
ncbi:hypothetical protein [Rhizobium sp. BIGb0125]